MAWHRVIIDIDRDQPPGIEPQQWIFEDAPAIYESLGRPDGFAIYEFMEPELIQHSFFFSPVAAATPHFAKFIKANQSEVWNKPLPDGVYLLAGDASISP